MYSIETENLTHHFSNKEVVLNNVNLQVPEGSVFGFLGPNGAGKTTTLRLLLGLLRKQQGSINFFGKPFAGNRIEILKNIGSLIESPSLYGHLSAVENLQVLQHIYQCPKSRIGVVLEMAGLAYTGGKKAAKFSLGMKQRLSIAVALLNNPPLLILDEPTNGLDPNGIIEMRELLKRLNREHGITIVISSHLLSEIERMVTHVGIIHKGAIRFQGTLDELRIKQTQNSVTQFSTNNISATADIVLAQGLQPAISNGLVIVPKTEKNMVAAINKQLVQAGVDVYGITTAENDLESIFMDLIKQ